MPFVDLSNPNSTDPANLNSTNNIQNAVNPTMEVQTNLPSNQVGGMAQSRQTQNNQGKMKEELSEEHLLLQNAPSEVTTAHHNGVREIKGPPLPGQIQGSIDTLSKLTTDQSSENNTNEINIQQTQSNSLPPMGQLQSQDSNKISEPKVESNLESKANPMSIPGLNTVASVPNTNTTTAAGNEAQDINSANSLSTSNTQNQEPVNHTETIQNNTQDSQQENNTEIPKIPGTNDLPSLDSILGKVPDPAPGTGKTKAINSARILTTFNISNASMSDFLAYTIANKASDLHIAAESPTYLRVDGSLRAIPGEPISNDRLKALVEEIMDDHLKEELKTNKEVDFSVQHESGDRFRANVFHKQGLLSIALRLIPNKIKTISELNLPEILYDFTKVPHGLVVVTGPTGSGKSTTIAAMIQEINMNRAEHIITIEDPTEYVYPKMKSLIEQREIGRDSHSWTNALRSVLRQDPNIVLVGEMRDFETIEAAVTVAETGHLVFATLHTNSAAQTVDRIIDVFPEGQQSQIRAQLANVLTAVIAQRLVPVQAGGRKAVLEIMIGNSAIRNAIREGKTYQIDNIIQTNTEIGMQTLETSLAKLVKAGELTAEVAANYTVKPDELYNLLKG